MLRPWDAAAFRGHDVSSFSLVVVDQFHIEGVFPFKPEHDAPVCPYRHRPETPDPIGAANRNIGFVAIIDNVINRLRGRMHNQW